MPLPQSSPSHAYPVPAPSLARRIDSLLLALRVRGRRAVRILDLGCGPGTRLLEAVVRARTLGFTAIEGYGVDARWPARAAPILIDPAIGLAFATGHPLAALSAEADSSCDLLLCDAALLTAQASDARTAAEEELTRVAGDGAILLTGIPLR